MLGLVKANIERLKFTLSSWQITLMTAAYMLLMFNRHFFETVYSLNGATGLESYIYIASLFVFLLVIINLILSILAFPWLLKPVLITLLICSSVACYYMDTYNILIDTSMIQNVMETDYKEGLELFSLKLIIFVVLTGVLPALIVFNTTIKYGSVSRFVVSKLATGTVSIVVIGVITLTFYQDYASLFRNNRYVRDLIVPVNYIHAFNAYSKQFYPQNIQAFEQIGVDATLGENWKLENKRKVVSVIIVGETARSANFSIFDYPRTTNPELSQKDIFSFSNVSSCGTSTAVSLPCMFSKQAREQYDEGESKYTDNILDVIQRAGLSVVWVDNNSGCKNVCTRINNEEIDISDNSTLCPKEECFDMILLDKLTKVIASAPKDNVVIVLHQKGSHGPAYFLRTPKEYQKFTPFCHTNQLQECTLKEITNAYDNTILYTDHVISSVIDYLESNKETFDASMLYVSDHGESLGENNLYLHGLPYFIAPQEQTNVPLVFWMNKDFSTRFGINESCLHKKNKEALSHDNLFDSLLGLLDIHTSLYQQKNDLFATCQIHKNFNSYVDDREGFKKT